MMHEGVEQKGYLSIDPGNAGIRLLDKDLEVVEAYQRPRPQQKKALGAQKTNAPAEAPVKEDVKKKSWNQGQTSNQKMNWSKQKSKGPSF